MRTAVEVIPDYLLKHTCTQDTSLYTPIDHACWRYIMRVARRYFAKHAHPVYGEGLAKTGISTERIPSIEEMDAALRKLGWRAVAVSGFIPPSVFLEFQSLGILPIACDMRKLEHVAYTPAPDIVHEAAGHAPIIADPDFSDYLRSYGEVARHAIHSDRDIEVYEAVRNLSDVKENPAATPAEVDAAQTRLNAAVASVSYCSEATQLARMAWWTTEYGLLESGGGPLIFGAGLLSSIGESFHCLASSVRKLPFSIDCVNMGYDITRPQPQLFVARGFRQLREALEEMAAGMAYRRGGMHGLAKAVAAATVTTTVLESGIQVSGKLTEIERDERGEPAFLRFTGSCQLSRGDRELPGHGKDRHPGGFSAPLGSLRETGRSPARLTNAELELLGFRGSASGRMEFSSGVVLSGRWVRELSTGESGRYLVLPFEQCRISWGDRELYRPEWGVFDLACGESVVSVFGGAADRARFAEGEPSGPRPRQKTNRTPELEKLNVLYARVRKAREAKDPRLADTLREVAEALPAVAPADWLLRLELAELAATHAIREPWIAKIHADLDRLRQGDAGIRELVDRGLALHRVGDY